MAVIVHSNQPNTLHAIMVLLAFHGCIKYHSGIVDTRITPTQALNRLHKLLPYLHHMSPGLLMQQYMCSGAYAEECICNKVLFVVPLRSIYIERALSVLLLLQKHSSSGASSKHLCQRMHMQPLLH